MTSGPQTARMPEDKLRITLLGRFLVLTADGQDLTPRSAKAQGVLALIASSPGMSRSRIWLQDKLWSDRGKDQASASLRQALAEIRRAFGPHADVVKADRQAVALDRAAVEPIALDGDAPPGTEFLEGIDVRDEEFESWLRLERSRRRSGLDAIPAGDINTPHLRRMPVLRPSVLFIGATRADSPLRLFEELFIDCVSRTLAEAMSVEVFVTTLPPGHPGATRIAVQPFDAGYARAGLRVTAIEAGSNRLIWSGTRVAETHPVLPDLDQDIQLLGNQLIDALSDALLLQVTDRPEQRNANYLHRLAIRKIFSMRPEQLVTADKLLEKAFEIDARGVYLAWRAQLRAIQQVERHSGRSDTLREEAAQFSYLAMEREPSNSMVLAAVANARLVLDGDVLGCEELSRQSVAMNPANPLAWDSLSTARMYAGEHEAAHALAIRAQRLGASAPHKFWWDMGLCMTAALTGRADLSLRMAEASAAMAPTFKPPLRYLTALYAYGDMPQKAMATAERLKVLEPDFSFDVIANDQRYPISQLRKTGLVRSDKLRALGK